MFSWPAKPWAIPREERGLSQGSSSLQGCHPPWHALRPWGDFTASQFYYIFIDPSPAASAQLLQLQEPCWELGLFTQLGRISPVQFIHSTKETSCSSSLLRDFCPRASSCPLSSADPCAGPRADLGRREVLLSEGSHPFSCSGSFPCLLCLIPALVHLPLLPLQLRDQPGGKNSSRAAGTGSGTGVVTQDGGTARSWHCHCHCHLKGGSTSQQH